MEASGYTWNDLHEATRALEREFNVTIKLYLVPALQTARSRKTWAAAAAATSLAADSYGVLIGRVSKDWPSNEDRTMPALFERVLYDLEKRLKARQYDLRAAKQSPLPF